MMMMMMMVTVIIIIIIIIVYIIGDQYNQRLFQREPPLNLQNDLQGKT